MQPKKIHPLWPQGTIQAAMYTLCVLLTIEAFITKCASLSPKSALLLFLTKLVFLRPDRSGEHRRVSTGQNTLEGGDLLPQKAPKPFAAPLALGCGEPDLLGCQSSQSGHLGKDLEGSKPRVPFAPGCESSRLAPIRREVMMSIQKATISGQASSDEKESNLRITWDTSVWERWLNHCARE